MFILVTLHVKWLYVAIYMLGVISTKSAVGVCRLSEGALDTVLLT